jgi:hypothetical protein
MENRSLSNNPVLAGSCTAIRQPSLSLHRQHGRQVPSKCFLVTSRLWEDAQRRGHATRSVLCPLRALRLLRFVRVAVPQHDVSRYNPVKGLGSWLTPDLYRIGGAPGYKAVGRAHIYDSITINIINYPHVYMLHL